MNGTQIVGILLILAGAFGLFYGDFHYTEESHEAKVGPIELSVKDERTIDVPVWASGGAIAIGVALLIFRRK